MDYCVTSALAYINKFIPDEYLYDYNLDEDLEEYL